MISSPLFASSQLTRDGKLKEHIALENAKCINIVLEHIIMFAKVHISNSWSSSILNIIVKYFTT
jgi:hypothetical protein